MQGISYTDGSSIEARILSLVNQAGDTSSESFRLMDPAEQWAVKYHLSPERANLIRHLDFSGLDVLELGAGMGALSRYLAEKSRTLTVIEGTEERFQVLSSRLRELKNWKGRVANIQDLEPEPLYDVVCLFGVLEYSELYVSGENPFLEVLKKAGRFLRPQGVVIVGIENQVGLKYLNAALEDHTGRFFDGICGYPMDKSPKTFSRKELLELLKHAGFPYTDQHFPFTDYKIPHAILSLDFIERFPEISADLATLRPFNHYGLPRKPFFPDALAARTFAKAGLLPDLANSFLFVGSSDPDSPIRRKLLTRELNQLEMAWYYSPFRKNPTQTVFRKNNGHVVAKKNMREIRKNYEGAFHCFEWQAPFEEPLSTQIPLQAVLSNQAYFENWDGFLKTLCSFLSWSFQHWSSEEQGTDCISENALDGTFFNACCSNTSIADYSLFDLEWKLSGPLSKTWFILRNIFGLIRLEELFRSSAPFSNFSELYRKLCTQFGLKPDFERDLLFEAEFQSIATEESSMETHRSQLSTFFQRSFRANPFPRTPSPNTQPSFKNRIMHKTKSILLLKPTLFQKAKALFVRTKKTARYLRNRIHPECAVTLIDGTRHHLAVLQPPKWGFPSGFVLLTLSFNVCRKDFGRRNLAAGRAVRFEPRGQLPTQIDLFLKAFVRVAGGSTLECRVPLPALLTSTQKRIEKRPSCRLQIPLATSSEKKVLDNPQWGCLRAFFSCVLSNGIFARQFWSFFNAFLCSFNVLGKDFDRRSIAAGCPKARRKILARLDSNLQGLMLESEDPLEVSHVKITPLFKWEAALYLGVIRFRTCLTDRPAAILQRPKLLRHILSTAYASLKQGLSFFRNNGLKGLKLWAKHEALQISFPVIDDYTVWIQNFDTITEKDRELINNNIASMNHKPLISLVMPVYNTDEIWLERAISSVLSQIYPYWELCIADDYSTRPHVRKVLEKFRNRDPRIKIVFRNRNGHISEASNSALELVSGEYTLLLDHDDEIPCHALYMVASLLSEQPDTDIIYSDEDKIDRHGRRFSPHFKTEWSADMLYSYNIMTHLSAYRTSLLREIGGFRRGFEGSQDYDVALRASEKTSPSRIRHIPHILYHWRSIPNSVSLAVNEKSYATLAARNAISSHLQRINIPARVLPGYGEFHRICYELPDKKPSIQVIICTRDKAKLLKETVSGLLEKTDYPEMELWIVDNESRNPETLRLLNDWSRNPRVNILRYEKPFNFSAMNNFAASQSKSHMILFLNNDVRVMTPDWLGEMAGFAFQPKIGAVGARLLYPDNTIQHAGVILGMNGGVADHPHRFLSAKEPGYFSRARIIQEFSAISAACMLLKRETFEKAGGFDADNLTVAYNDIDLCLKIRKLGYRIVWTPYAELYHLESQSRGPDTDPVNQKRFSSEFLYMKQKWGSALLEDPFFNPNLSLESNNYSLAFPPRTITR